MDDVTTILDRQATPVPPASAAGADRDDHSLGQQHDRAAIQPFCAARLGVHVARARVAGEWKRPLAAMAEEIATVRQAPVRRSARSHRVPLHRHLDDAGTAGRRPHPRHRAGGDRHRGGRDQPAGARGAAGAAGCASSSCSAPTRAIRSVIDYLQATGFDVVHDVALALEPLEFAAVTPREWTELARQHDRPEADGIFLSCTNTTQIEAIADIERALGKPVVNSNQAVLWGCLKRLALGARPAAADAGARAADARHGCMTDRKGEGMKKLRRSALRRRRLLLLSAPAADAQSYPGATDHAHRPVRARRPCRFPRPRSSARR